MFDTVYIVTKSCMTTGQSVFEKVFFKKEMARIYITKQRDPELYNIQTYVESKRDDGTAKEII